MTIWLTLRTVCGDTDILQEYFIPYDRMPEFVDSLRTVVQRDHSNLLNVTIRTVHNRHYTPRFPYAKQDVFAFVSLLQCEVERLR